MKYEYKKVTGYEQKKFIENGHTMLEEDVLQRLKRLEYLEEQLRQAKDVVAEQKASHIDSVMPRALFENSTTFCRHQKNDRTHRYNYRIETIIKLH